jgi:parallel beta-helix repeat protein
MRLLAPFIAGGLVLVLASPLAVTTTATTYYLTTSGNDANPGSAELPLRTVREAISRLKPGDTLLVGAGTFSESVSGAIPSGTSWTAPVTLRALDPTHRPILKPGAGTARVLNFAGEQYIVVDGFVLDGANVDFDVVKVTDGDRVSAAHHIRIINSELKNAPNQCVLTTNGANFNEFVDNDIHDCGVDDFRHGIYISTDNNLIRGNLVYRNAGWGVHIYDGTDGGGSAAHDNLVWGNIVHDNARVGNRGNGIILSSGARNIAANNVVYANNGGISVDYHAVDSQVVQNTILNNSNFGVYIGDSIGAVIENNIIYRNSFRSGGRATLTNHNLVGTDPLFVAESTGDFHLSGRSPAVDAGTTIVTVPTDADGTKRPQGAAFDIGAYEYPGLRIQPRRPPFAIYRAMLLAR